MSDYIENIIMEDVPGNCIFWKNFSGKPIKTENGVFNTDGRRTFHLALDEDYARELEKKGWSIKWPKVQDEDNSRKPLMKVTLRFDVVPPEVYMVNSDGKLRLDESTVRELDYSYIEKMDVIITPSKWKHGTESGTTAYVKKLYAFMEEDPISKKYKDIPDRNAPSNGAFEDEEVPF